MAKNKAREKQSYGSIAIIRLSPPKKEGWLKAVNTVGFKEAVRLGVHNRRLPVQHPFGEISRNTAIQGVKR